MKHLSSISIGLLLVCICLAEPSRAEEKRQVKSPVLIEKVTKGVPFAIAADDAAPPPPNALYRVVLKNVPLKQATDALGREMDVKIHLPQGDIRKVRVSLDEKRIGLMAALTKITKGKFWGSKYAWGKTKHASGTLTAVTYVLKDPKGK
jgi:hypothetical protein